MNTIQQKTNKLLETLFGKDFDNLQIPFITFTSPKKETGKLYLPLDISLTPLVEANVGFKWIPEIREDKIVIQY